MAAGAAVGIGMHSTMTTRTMNEGSRRNKIVFKSIAFLDNKLFIVKTNILIIFRFYYHEFTVHNNSIIGYWWIRLLGGNGSFACNSKTDFIEAIIIINYYFIQ